MTCTTCFFFSENRDINDPNLFEGDMILTPEQRGNIEMGLDVFKTDRQGAAIRGRLWPGGVVAYDISPALGKFFSLGIYKPITNQRTNIFY